MNTGWNSDIATRSWARFVWNPSAGVTEASGDCMRLLGIEGRSLVESSEPLHLLPQGLSASLMSGTPETPLMTGYGNLLFTLDPSAGGIVVTVFEFLEGDQAGSHSMVEDLGTGVVGVDPSGIIRLWNRAMTGIIPIKSEAAIGRSLESLVPAPVLFAWSGVMSEVADGKTVRAEIRPGVRRRVEAVFSRGGPGMIGVFVDTSDSFEVERRLRSARRMNQTYFQSISTGLVMLSQDLRVLVSNRAFGRIFGVREGLPGVAVYEVLPAECFASLDQAVRRLQAGEPEIPPSTVAFTLPGGGSRVVVQTFKPVRSEEDDSLQVVGIFEDFTDRFTLSETLERNTARNGRMIQFIDLLNRTEPSAIPGIVVSSVARLSGATAAALFNPDRLRTSRLAASTGDWSFQLPEDFIELRLPRAAWSGSPGLCIRLDELRPGTVSEECLDVIPIGAGNTDRGFLVLLFPTMEEAQDFLAEATMLSAHIASSLEAAVRASQIDQLVASSEREKQFSSDLLAGIGIPVAVFGEDWRVIHWNREMADLTGLDSDSAKKRSTSVIEMLFGPVGGISEARKMAGTQFSPPTTWTVRRPDGSETACSWRLFRSERSDGDSAENVCILSGMRLDDAAAGRMKEGHSENTRLLTSAISRLAYSSSPRQFASALADFTAAVTGAAGVTAILPMGDGIMEARSGKTRGERTMTLSIPAPDGLAEHSARLELTDDAARGNLELIGYLASGALAGSLACSLGRGLMDWGGPPQETTVFFTDEAGMVTSPGIVEGIWVEGGVHVSRLVPLGSDEIRETARQARLFGYGSVVFDAGKSGRRAVLVVTPLEIDGRSRLIWHSVPTEESSASPVWLRAVRDLAVWLPDKARDARGKLSTISRMLDRDNPVRPVLMSLLLDMASLARVSRLLGYMGRAILSRPAGVPSADILGLLVQKCIAKGRRPPDLDLSSEPPVVRVDAGLISDIMETCISVAGHGATPSIRVGRLPGPMDGTGGIRQGSGGLAVFEIGWERSLEPRMPLDQAMELAASGSIPPAAELELLAIALELSGCIFELDGNEIRIVTPAEMEEETLAPEV